jgi:hypothetical protein
MGCFQSGTPKLLERLAISRKGHIYAIMLPVGALGFTGSHMNSFLEEGRSVLGNCTWFGHPNFSGHGMRLGSLLPLTTYGCFNVPIVRRIPCGAC